MVAGLDLFYGKGFLDDLQLHVQCSVAKVGQVTRQQTRLSLTTRKKKRNSDMSTASVSIFQPGTIVFKKEKPVKCQYRSKRERSSTEDGTEDARRIAWRLRVEESQKFVDRLVPTYPQPVHSARKTPMAKTCSQCNAMQKASASLRCRARNAGPGTECGCRKEASKIACHDAHDVP